MEEHSWSGGGGGATKIRRGVLEAIVAHARAEAPLECCGLLIGADGIVEEACPARNLDAAATTFLVDPADHFAAIRKARAAGRVVVGAYHSHPRSAAVPSATDRRQSHDAGFLHLIVSLADPAVPEVRAWWLDEAAPAEAGLTEIP